MRPQAGRKWSATSRQKWEETYRIGQFDKSLKHCGCSCPPHTSSWVLYVLIFLLITLPFKHPSLIIGDNIKTLRRVIRGLACTTCPWVSEATLKIHIYQVNRCFPHDQAENGQGCDAPSLGARSKRKHADFNWQRLSESMVAILHQGYKYIPELQTTSSRRPLPLPSGGSFPPQIMRMAWQWVGHRQDSATMEALLLGLCLQRSPLLKCIDYYRVIKISLPKYIYCPIETMEAGSEPNIRARFVNPRFYATILPLNASTRYLFRCRPCCTIPPPAYLTGGCPNSSGHQNRWGELLSKETDAQRASWQVGRRG